MKIKKVEGTDGYMLFLNDDTHIIFTSAEVVSDSLVSYLYNCGYLACMLYSDQSKQFGELWKAINPAVRPHQRINLV